MKIKVWAFVLIIVGTVAFTCVGTFAAVKGVDAVSGLVSSLRQGRGAQASVPDGSQALPGRRSGGTAALPANFNAGVSIAATYGAMTNRAEDEVLAAAEQAGTSTWGLAQREGKLDELKQKVLAAVKDSLKAMVTKGTITQDQSDTYLQWVNQYLNYIDADTVTGATSGSGRSGGNWNDDQGQQLPWGTADPGSIS